MNRGLKLLATVAIVVTGVNRTSLAADDKRPLHSQEAAFLRERAQGDVFEWRMGEYAQQHGGTQQIKDMGKQMATDHHADLKDILQVAQAHDLTIEVPKTLTAPQQATYDSLIAKEGGDFDRAYSTLLVSEHNRELAQAQRERDHGQDNDVRDYAGKIAGTLENHLKMARDGQKSGK